MHLSSTSGRRRHLAAAAVAAAVVIACGGGCSVSSEDSEEVASESTSALRQYDPAFGNRIADKARRVDGRPSRNWCLAEVQNSLEAAGVRAFPRLPGAVDLDNWLMQRGGELAAWGFEKQSVDVNNIPRGSIIAWRPGQCGYHGTYGHIEIVVDRSRACSDYCGAIKRGCGAPNVYVPVGSNPGGGGGGGGGACAVQQDGKLHCSNTPGTPMYAEPRSSSPVVNHMRSSYSWFECWGTGEPHRGGNSTWYRSVGDDNGNRGWIPAAEMGTSSELDANPRGLARCQ